MRYRNRPLVSLCLTLALGATACGGGSDDPTIQPGGEEAGHTHEDAGEGHDDQGTKEIAGEEAVYHGTTGVSGMTSFGLELDDFYFGPTVLDGEPGQSLTLDLHNEGQAPHTFTLDQGDVDVELEPGATGTADVVFPSNGALVFACRFHRGQGMIGALSVGGSLGTGDPAGETGEETSGDTGFGYDYG